MKRLFSYLMILLFLSLSACSTVTPTVHVKPDPTLVTPVPKATMTPEPTLPAAQMPPLVTGEWQRVSDDLMPFSFEMPNHWNVPEGGRLTWVPDGSILEVDQKLFGVNVLFDASAPDSDLLPGNCAVESRDPLTVDGKSYTIIQLTLFNGPNGTESAYETFVVVPVQSVNRAFVFYVSAPSKQDRAALQDILLHAVQTIEFKS